MTLLPTPSQALCARWLAFGGLVAVAGCVDLEERAGGLAGPSANWCAARREEVVDCTLDGDTFRVGGCAGGASESIRLLGVAAPEVANAESEAQCFGDEASEFLDDLVTGERVDLTFDVDCEDIYGRTLAWVWLEGDDPAVVDILDDLGGDWLESDGEYKILVNELLVRAGYAELYDEGFAQDVRYYDDIGDAEQEAEQAGLGLWSACTR